MSVAEARTWGDKIKGLGDNIVGLTLLEAKELGDYLEDVHGIKAAAGAVMAGPVPGGPGPVAPVEEQTSFDVVLENFGTNKIAVIKVVRAATALGLKEAKELVEGAPKTVKEGLSKADAEKLKKELEDSGAKVALK